MNLSRNDLVRTDECWEWQRARTRAGYGTLRTPAGVAYTHRLAYTAFVGPIPAGMELDHLCRVPSCFNPSHLEAVTHAENMRRGFFGSKTHCPAGHPYDAENTVINSTNGGRLCRACKNGRRRKGAARSKTHCPQGHERSAENRRAVGNTTLCVPCKLAQSAAYKLRKKAER